MFALSKSIFCTEDDTIMSNMHEKEFSDFNFNKEVIGKISILKKLSQISHIPNNRNFSSIIEIY